MLNKSLLILCFLLTALWAASAFTPLTIGGLHFTCWLLIVSIVTGISGLGRTFYRWSASKAVVMAALSLALLFVVKTFLVWGGDWKTQTILYQNRQSEHRVIAFQMQDVGAMGYNKRTVEQIDLLPGVSWLSEVYATPLDIPPHKLDSLNWKKVDIDKNELGLRFP